MEKNKHVLIIIALLGMILCMTIVGTGSVFADDNQPGNLEVEPNGIFVALDIQIKGNGNGTITATATNKFTLGNTILQVVVKLYASDTFAYDISDMDLIASNSVTDLNIFDSISVTANTNSKSKYWCAVVDYKRDNDGWQTKATNIALFDEKGNIIK